MTFLSRAGLGALLLTVAACSGGSATPTVAGFCAAYLDYEAFREEDQPDTSDPEQVRASFEGTVDALEEVRAAAPDEVRADVQVQLDAFEDARAALEAANFDLEAAGDEALAGFNTEEVSQARDAVGEYAETNCEEETASPTPSETPSEMDVCEIASYVGSQWQHVDDPKPDTNWEITIGNLRSNLESTRDAAPDELQPSLERLVQGVTDLETRWAAADWDPSIAEDLHELEEPDFLEARATFDAYNSDECGFGEK